jgi:hypothetical protein
VEHLKCASLMFLLLILLNINKLERYVRDTRDERLHAVANTTSFATVVIYGCNFNKIGNCDCIQITTNDNLMIVLKVVLFKLKN